MEDQSDKKRVLAIFAHADDELGVAGTLANFADSGHEVLLTFLTKGENSTTVDGDEVETAKKRKIHTEKIESLLGIKVKFLAFPDSRIEYNVANGYIIAELIKEFKPNVIITWTKYTRVGGGHPDHRNCADLVRDAISYARYNNKESNWEPYRDFISFYTYHNQDNQTGFPLAYIDVTSQIDKIKEFIKIYQVAYGDWPVEDFKMGTMLYHGRLAGVKYAEVFEEVYKNKKAKLILD